MSSSTVSIAILATLLFVSSTMGHSQMRCAKYNPLTGECYAPIRDAGQSFLEEAHDISVSGTALCQKPMAKPITAAYSSGAACSGDCPAPMGTYTAGETFTVQWVARNHAVSDQTPGNISLYLSPVESVNQGMDVSADVFKQNKFCTAPFMSCQGKNGDLVPCFASCTMPSNLQTGYYTLWWKWVWPGHTSVYSTCADILVSASGNTPVPTTPTPAPTLPSTTGAAAVPLPSTTGSKAPVVPSTTGSKAPATPVTTGRVTQLPTKSTTGSSAPQTGTCDSGKMKCLTSETYSTCNAGSWGPSQSCTTGTMCSPSGDYIYCVVNTSPATPAPTPAPTTPTAPTTPSTSSTSSSDSSCVMGYQKCTGANTYSICGNGVKGPQWSTDLPCQAGLKCHESSANTIYCY